MKLLGVDVGFSKTRRTTGIAWLEDGKLDAVRAESSWESRKARIPDGYRPDVIALDGPLLPHEGDDPMRRQCEAIFIRAPFHNRCKPGLSHFGFGLQLRRATSDAYGQFSQLLAHPDLSKDQLPPDGQIIEAFPNAFLGVLLPESEFRSSPKLRRGRRFDWLYDRVASTDLLESKLAESLLLPDEVWRRIRVEQDHELRAALICLLTAALAARNFVEKVGDGSGGWFWLPPVRLWERWAREGLETARKQWDSA